MAIPAAWRSAKSLSLEDVPEGSWNSLLYLRDSIRRHTMLHWNVDFTSGHSKGLAGTPIWSSDVMDIDLPARVNQLIDIKVPGVLVPGEFAWTVEKISQVLQAGLPFASGVTTGVPGDFVVKGGAFSGFEGLWRRNNNTFSNGYGVRFIAIPEPTSAVILIICLFSCAGRSFRRVSNSRSDCREGDKILN